MNTNIIERPMPLYEEDIALHLHTYLSDFACSQLMQTNKKIHAIFLKIAQGNLNSLCYLIDYSIKSAGFIEFEASSLEALKILLDDKSKFSSLLQISKFYCKVLHSSTKVFNRISLVARKILEIIYTRQNPSRAQKDLIFMLNTQHINLKMVTTLILQLEIIYANTPSEISWSVRNKGEDFKELLADIIGHSDILKFNNLELLDYIAQNQLRIDLSDKSPKDQYSILKDLYRLCRDEPVDKDLLTKEIKYPPPYLVNAQNLAQVGEDGAALQHFFAAVSAAVEQHSLVHQQKLSLEPNIDKHLVTLQMFEIIIGCIAQEKQDISEAIAHIARNGNCELALKFLDNLTNFSRRLAGKWAIFFEIDPEVVQNLKNGDFIQNLKHSLYIIIAGNVEFDKALEMLPHVPLDHQKLSVVKKAILEPKNRSKCIEYLTSNFSFELESIINTLIQGKDLHNALILMQHTEDNLESIEWSLLKDHLRQLCQLQQPEKALEWIYVLDSKALELSLNSKIAKFKQECALPIAMAFAKKGDFAKAELVCKNYARKEMQALIYRSIDQQKKLFSSF